MGDNICRNGNLQCSVVFGYKQTQGNNQDRLKSWLVYRLGVLDKVYLWKHTAISLQFRLGLTLVYG